MGDILHGCDCRIPDCYEEEKMTLDKAKKLLEEEYERAKRLEYVRDPLAYALYQVWKMADKERKRK